MKKLVRILVFSMVSLYLTSLWNLGFSFSKEPILFLKTSIIIAVIFYLILPLSKLILLPLNMLTLGLASLILYFVILHFLNSLSVISIKSWQFYGLSFLGITLPKANIQYSINLLLSALSISTIINFFEKLI